ncbi:MAG TPA: type II 3-dehydroquinate dehydratase [Chloroflexota bacterium]|nr:type II 3-dehydroquinate dehydratase [Chloroflexota bacterium]
MKNILVLHGPNLNLTGRREPDVYGTTTLDDINRLLEARAVNRAQLRILQTNHEGTLIDTLQDSIGWADGALFNPGALTHYAYALRDAITAVDYPVVEVHMSVPAAREDFRHQSVIAPVARGQVAGFGWYSYLAALDTLLHLLEAD